MLRGLELGMYAILALCCVWVDYLLRVRDLSTGTTTRSCPFRPLKHAPYPPAAAGVNDNLAGNGGQ